MSYKQVRILESQYMAALNMAIFYKCDLTVEQFAACHALDPEELEALKAHLERQGVGV